MWLPWGQTWEDSSHWALVSGLSNTRKIRKSGAWREGFAHSIPLTTATLNILTGVGGEGSGIQQ